MAVASSKMKIEGLWAKILANANNCFSPAEKDEPLSFAISQIPFGREETKPSAEDNLTASTMSSSVILLLFSLILFAMLLAKIKGSCKIIPMCALKLRLLIFLIFTPSNRISPCCIS